MLFGAAVHARNALYDSGALAPRQLQGPVISVGNLSVGGSGKTPFVILLGELLKQRGMALDVLSRGYGRASRGAALVDPGGGAREFGDEPLLIARRLRVPVVVAEERYCAGTLAERHGGPRLHLLDDGFQHRQLARQFDIVLITDEDLSDHLLPAGRLREPLSSLSRADAIVAVGDADVRKLRSSGQKLLWRVRRGLVLPERLPSRLVAFCGIARPQNFFAALRAAGVEPAAEVAFRDHHAYTQGDARRLLRARDETHAEGFITTEKDAINLESLRPQLEPVAVAAVRMSLDDAEPALDAMLDTLRQRGKPAS